MKHKHSSPIFRIWALMRADVILHRQAILIAALAAMVTLLFISAFAASFHSNWEFHHMISFPLLLLVGGALVTSMSMGDFHDPRRGPAALTLPASPREKLLARFSLTLFGYGIAVIPFFYLFYFLSRITCHLLFDHVHPPIAIRSGYFTVAFFIFLFFHAFYFLGALFFKKQSFIRTTLVLCVLGSALDIFRRLLVPNLFRYLGIIHPFEMAELYHHFMGIYAIFGVIPIFSIPVCWFAALLRIKEIEV
jgi:hypothetical protein